MGARGKNRGRKSAVSKPSADDNAKSDINQKIVDWRRAKDAAGRRARRLAPAERAQIDPAQNKSAIRPAHTSAAEADRD